MKEKKTKTYLDRGWPYGLTRIDKKRIKSHNTTPKKFRYKKEKQEEPTINMNGFGKPEFPHTMFVAPATPRSGLLGKFAANAKYGVIGDRPVDVQDQIMDLIMEEEE